MRTLYDTEPEPLDTLDTHLDADADTDAEGYYADMYHELSVLGLLDD